MSKACVGLNPSLDRYAVGSRVAHQPNYPLLHYIVKKSKVNGFEVHLLENIKPDRIGTIASFSLK